MTHASKRCHECGNIIVPKRPLDIVEYITAEEMHNRKMLKQIEDVMPFLKKDNW